MGKHTKGMSTTRTNRMNKGLSAQGGKHLSKRERIEERRNIETNRAEVRKLELARRNRRNMIASSLIITLIISFGFIYNTYVLNGDGESRPEGTELQAGDTGIIIPKTEITENASFYRYDDNGVEIRAFGVKGSDGKEHIAADACDRCYKEKKGYRQEGENMTCNNCGQKFEINSIGTENTEGGCWPSFIEIDTEGDDITLTEEALKDKRYLFE